MNITKKIAVIALMSATLTGGKMALSFLPNIEIVSLLLAIYAYVFGLGFALPCAFVFVSCEMFIWGINTWVVLYYIYWPCLAVVFYLLGKRKAKTVWCVVAVVISTLFFGVFSTLIDVGLFMGNFENFWYKFGVMYTRGIVFFAIHLISNLALFSALFSPLKTVVDKINTTLFKEPSL